MLFKVRLCGEILARISSKAVREMIALLPFPDAFYL
jgi:hypothetical protein